MNKKVKVIILIIFFLILFVPLGILYFLAFANPQWHKELYMIQKNGICGIRISPSPIRPPDYNGLWIDWHENGAKKYEGKFVNGKETGRHLAWYDNGNRRSVYDFENGKRHGMHTVWYENGIKMSRGIFSNGKRTGIHHTWNSNGNYHSLCNYDENGELHGKQFKGWKKGSFPSQYFYNHGRKLYYVWNYNYSRPSITRAPGYTGKVKVESRKEIEELLRELRREIK